MQTHKYTPLPFSRYDQTPDQLAQNLLGKLLVHSTEGSTYSGIIVETESYHGKDDPASHGYRSITPRNHIMFEGAGYIYMYRSYGIHTCFNITASPAGESGAVLVRALHPVDGIASMYLRRSSAKKDTDLCSGPGKLCEALDMTMDLYGHAISTMPLVCSDIGIQYAKNDITQTTRIGLHPDKGATLPYRRYVTNNPNVSRK